MAATCSNCGTCTCTGSYLVVAHDGKQCCSKCVDIYNQLHPVEPINSLGNQPKDIEQRTIKMRH
jgi:hypothetical protein